MGPTPDLPAIRLFQNVERSFPIGEMTPTPVITTRLTSATAFRQLMNRKLHTLRTGRKSRAETRRDFFPDLLLMRFDVLNHISHRGDFFRLFIGNLQTELIFQLQNEIHHVE